MPILGLHHVTATVDDAQDDLDFCLGALGVRLGSKGAGQVTVTSFSVPTGALGAWRKRLEDVGVAVTDLPPRFGEPVVRFADRSGLAFELIATDRDARTPWVASGFDAGTSI